MKKVGIVTLVGYFNYGNRLQNYALQETLKKLNFEVYSLKFENDPNFLNSNNKSDESIIKKIEGKSLNQIIEKLKNTVSVKKRTKKFKQFTYEYINEVDYDGKEENLDFFVTGSDQVWNPAFIVGKPQTLLGFASPHKRISYSASFGVSEISKEVTPVFKEELGKFKEISVREKDGAKIIKKLLNREVPVLVDPTMLLDSEEWSLIAKKAKNRPDDSYILTYFLGGPSGVTRKKIEKVSKENNMSIINLGDINEKETYETGPSEFLDYIKNADLFFTDSFHGVVFSIIFKTPFVIFERASSGKSMYSRIETLLDMFDMRDREAMNFKGELFDMDFSDSLKIIETEYSKSMNYLEKAFMQEINVE